MMKRDPKADLIVALTPQQRDDAARAESAIAKQRTMEREIKALQKRLGDALDMEAVMRDYVKAAPPPVPFRPRPRASRNKPRIEQISLFGDLHIGQKVSKAETDSWGEYNLSIAQARTKRYYNEQTDWLEIQRHGYQIDRGHLLVLGDCVSGDIHDELRVHAEFPAPVQQIEAGALISELAGGLSSVYKQLDVYCVVGNHGRLTHKPQYTGGVQNSFDYAAYQYAKLALRNVKNVKWHIAESKAAMYDICNHHIIVTHGDAIRGWAGHPWYGFERALAREAMRQMMRAADELRRTGATRSWVDYYICGHFHVPVIGPGGMWRTNGSLVGTSELDHANARHAGPQQSTCLISPKHGIFSPVSWRL